MTTFLVTRHAATRGWIANRGYQEARVVPHLTAELIAALTQGDVVIGTLPIQLIAEVGERGARYVHLSIDMTPDMRGVELTEADIDRLGGRLEEFKVSRVRG